MEGTEIAREWRRFKDSDEGRKALNPYTLGGSSPRAHEYLENRLEVVFLEGIKAAERASNVPAPTGS